jgi:acetyl-CoA acetyltransferase
MHDARLERAMLLKTAVGEDLEHLAVLAEHVGLEFLDTVRVGDASQMLQQICADAAALEAVENGECDLGAGRILSADVAADSDEALAAILRQRRDQADVSFEVELGETLQIIGGQVAPDTHEAKIDRLFAEAVKVLEQALLVIGTNGADLDGAAVEHRCVGAVVARIVEGVAVRHFAVEYIAIALGISVVFRYGDRCGASMSEFTIKDKVAIVGLGETKYYKRGAAPVSEFRLALEAIQRAADDAGLPVTAIDGIASYSNDRNDSVRVATALGLPELRFTNMFWGGGGGGGSGAIGNAAAAIVAGFATCVVVYRALAQGQFGRFGATPAMRAISGPIAYTWPYGMSTPAQWIALRTRRFMHDHHITQDPLAAIAMACYHHAQSNPRAIMYGRPLTRQQYDESRWIVEPFHLYDCCLENDGAAAVIVTSAERARDLRQRPAYVMASAQGSDFRQGAAAENGPDYATSNFKTLAPRLYAMAEIEPKDVDVAQVYENFTGAVMTSIVEHGFCQPDEVMEFLTFDNLTAPRGKLPINTSGGNLAECYMHGLELIIEAARQVRGESTCQVKDAEISMVVSGPMVAPVSDLILRR